VNELQQEGGIEASLEIVQVPIYWAGDVEALYGSTFLLSLGLSRRVEAETEVGD
jgi:hypothetical protein